MIQQNNIDNNILFYEDETIYLEITISSKRYWSEATLTMEYDLMWKNWVDYYPIIYFSRKEIETANELNETILQTIEFSKKNINYEFNPFEKSIIERFSSNMIWIYWI